MFASVGDAYLCLFVRPHIFESATVIKIVMLVEAIGPGSYHKWLKHISECLLRYLLSHFEKSSFSAPRTILPN